MKKLILFLFLAIPLLGVRGLFAQSVTISPNGTSAIIDANSTTKGFLPPRMTQVQRSSLTPTAGLEVYCTDCTPAGPYSYNGTTWLKMFDYQTASGPCVQYTVGQAAQGGIVIWVDDSGQHGIVAAQSDIYVGAGIDSDGIPYIYNSTGAYNFIVAPSLGIYGGQKNTDKIVEVGGWSTYAAFLCQQIGQGSLGQGNYGDWYLPSLVELQIMYNNRNLLPTLKTVPDSYYWSSTESYPDQAHVVEFSSGNTYSFKKNYPYLQTGINTFFPLRVRSIRRF